jgi:DNA-binding winged helix-turn-helix (wHTH) protein
MSAVGNGSASTESFVYRGKHLLADFDAVAVSVDGDPDRLTRREFELLRYLVENKNRVLSRDRLLERVWGYDRLVETRSVDVHVGRLRGKLGAAGRQIETVVGLGYRFRRVLRLLPARQLQIARLTGKRHSGALDAMPVRIPDTRYHAAVLLFTNLPSGTAGVGDRESSRVIGLVKDSRVHATPIYTSAPSSRL